MRMTRRIRPSPTIHFLYKILEIHQGPFWYLKNENTPQTTTNSLWSLKLISTNITVQCLPTVQFPSKSTVPFSLAYAAYGVLYHGPFCMDPCRSWVESRRSLSVKADDPKKDESGRSGLKADDLWVKADDPGRKQTVLCQSRRSFWVKADDLWVKADDPGRKQTILQTLIPISSP